MELNRVMNGNCPFVTHVPVYKATLAIDNGAVLSVTANTASVKGAALSVAITTAGGKNSIGVSQVSSSLASAAPENANSIGAERFNLGTDGLADFTTADGGQYMPLCVTPEALYFAWYSTTVTGTTVSDAIELGISASVGTVVTIASTSVDFAGGWLFTDDESASTFSGSLRHIQQTVAVHSFGLNVAMNVSTDSELIWASAPLAKQTIISSGGNFLRSYSGATYGKIAQAAVILDNYIKHDSSGGMRPLRFWAHDGLDGLKNVRIFSEIALTDSYFANG